MGLISDTFEDNRERDWDRVHWGTAPAPSVSPIAASRRIFPCPACNAVLGAQEALAHHLFERHARDLFFVRLDGVVVPDVYYTRRSVRSLEVVAIGTSELRLEATASGGARFTGGFAPGDVADLPRALSLGSDFRGTISLSGRVGAYERSYEVHVRELPPFDPAPVDAAVRAAQAPLLSGDDPELSSIMRARDAQPLDSLSRRYLDGFGEYLEGVYRERRQDWASARERYEHAFGKLRVFPTALAQSVVGILEFRMLAGPLLLQRGTRSIFWPAGVLLATGPGASGSPVTSDWGSNGIWIDDFQEGLLRGAHAWARGDAAEAMATAQQLPGSLLDGPGNRRRSHLLLARAAAACLDRERARRAYHDLQDDPDYGHEARAYLERT